VNANTPSSSTSAQIDDALAYHGTTEHSRFWSQSIGFWPPVGITQTVLDERIVLNNHLREPATWYTDFQQCAVLDPSYEAGSRLKLPGSLRILEKGAS